MAVTWDNFDKGFWVSSTNMRNLIEAAINASIQIQSLQNQVNVIQNQIGNLQNQQSQIWQNISDIWGDLADIHGDLADVFSYLLDHEQRLTAGGL